MFHFLSSPLFYATSLLLFTLLLLFPIDCVCGEHGMKYSLFDVYPARQASFGANIADYGTVNLILPPRGMTDLCSDTKIAEYTANAAALPQNTVDNYKMAILVDGTQCSAGDQYRNAIQLKTRAGANHLNYLIIETEKENPDSVWPILLDSDDPDSNFSLNAGSTTTDSNFHSDNSSFSIGLWSTTYRAGEAMRDEIETFQNRSTKVIMSPYLFDKNNEQWDMIGTFSMFWYSQTAEVPNHFYWFRILLFALLICSPCIRAMYLWWAAGGRFMLRRNGQGRVTGLQYVRPANDWLRAGLPGSRPAGDSVIRVLTETEFDSLPVFVYKPSDDNKKQQELADDDDDDDEVDPCVEEPDIEMATRTSSDIHSVSPLSSQQPLPVMTSSSSTVNNLTTVSLDLRLENRNSNTEPQQEGQQEHATAATTTTTTTDPKQRECEYTTSCTLCSVCIDDFVTGERLILLPKCKHSFHRDCIHPWLTERQGCCPLCKTGVLEQEQEEEQLSIHDDDEENNPQQSLSVSSSDDILLLTSDISGNSSSNINNNAGPPHRLLQQAEGELSSSHFDDAMGSLEQDERRRH